MLSCSFTGQLSWHPILFREYLVSFFWNRSPKQRRSKQSWSWQMIYQLIFSLSKWEWHDPPRNWTLLLKCKPGSSQLGAPLPKIDSKICLEQCIVKFPSPTVFQFYSATKHLYCKVAISNFKPNFVTNISQMSTQRLSSTPCIFRSAWCTWQSLTHPV